MLRNKAMQTMGRKNILINVTVDGISFLRRMQIRINIWKKTLHLPAFSGIILKSLTLDLK